MKDLGMTGHTPPLKGIKKLGEMPLPSLSSFKMSILEMRLGISISPCFLRGGYGL